MLYLVNYEFPQNKAIFSKINSKSSKLKYFAKKIKGSGKNSSILRKISSFSASKLNETVVTNYTRYHKCVKKKPELLICLLANQCVFYLSDPTNSI